MENGVVERTGEALPASPAVVMDKVMVHTPGRCERLARQHGPKAATSDALHGQCGRLMGRNMSSAQAAIGEGVLGGARVEWASRRW